MWKRKKRLLALLCLPALALVFLLFVHGDADMPSYKGHSLSYWAKQLKTNPNPGEEREEALTAIRSLCPANIPLLLSWLGYDYEARYARMQRAFRRLPRSLQDALMKATMDGALRDSQQRRAEIAETVLPIILPELGSEATAAFSQLSKLMDSTNTAISDGAMDLASRLGMNGLALLLPVVADENHPRRFEALLAVDKLPFLVRYTSNSVPVLVRCTHSHDPKIATQAADTLAFLQRASISVPILIAVLSDPDPQIRSWAICVLGRFGSVRNPRSRQVARSAVPFLIKALGDPILEPREEAPNALLQLAPELLTNAPAR